MAKKIEGWADRNGQIYKTEAEADRADAREDLDNFLELVVDREGGIDLDMFIRNRVNVIEALRKFD